jgi:hypothetical protein
MERMHGLHPALHPSTIGMNYALAAPGSPRPLARPVHVGNPADIKSPVSFYPNPCKIGQTLNIREEFTNKESLEVLIFDIQGRLVSKNMLTNRSSFHAPSQAGVYTILIREEGRLIGIEKQIIME